MIVENPLITGFWFAVGSGLAGMLIVVPLAVGIAVLKVILGIK